LFLITIAQILGVLIDVVVMLVIIQFVIGLLFAFNVLGRSNQFFITVYEAINALLDPVLRPIRRVMPATGAIDFSPLVLIIGLTILKIVVDNLAIATVA
jgi:YggT family protein